MKRQLLMVAFIAILLLACSKVEIDVKPEDGGVETLTETEIKFLDTGLTLLIINTDNQELPTCEYVSAPEGSMGRGITNTTKVNGQLVVWRKDTKLYDSGKFLVGESGMTLRIRGNSSAYTGKKPFKIQLEKKADLLFRGDRYKDKSWVLIKDSEAGTLIDEMSLKPLIGNKVAELVGMDWVPQGQYVNLLINDDYKGIYYLCENVKRNEKCRIDVTKDGYVCELDPYWWNENTYFDTNYTSGAFKYTFKEPDEEDLSDERVSYIKNAIIEMEQGLEDDTYPFYIDVTSFAKWILAHDILGTMDAGGINKFFYKKDNTPNTLIKMGPLWDFDGIMKAGEVFPSIHANNTYNFYFSKLFGSEYFLSRYREEWELLSETLYDKLYVYLADYIDSEDGKGLEKSRVYETEMSGIEYRSVFDNVRFAEDYLSKRRDWLSQAIEAIAPLQTNIGSSAIKPLDEKIWGSDGREKNQKKGLYIFENKVYLQNN